MVARAVSARDSLTPLAVLIPIGATPLLALWAFSQHSSTAGAVFAVLVLAGGLTAVVVAGRRTYGVRTCVITTILTWLAAILAQPFVYGVTINTSACGKDVAAAWVWLPPTVAALVFFALGSWGFRTHRAFAVVPLAGVLALFVVILLYAAVPGPAGGCET